MIKLLPYTLPQSDNEKNKKKIALIVQLIGPKELIIQKGELADKKDNQMKPQSFSFTD